MNPWWLLHSGNVLLHLQLVFEHSHLEKANIVAHSDILLFRIPRTATDWVLTCTRVEWVSLSPRVLACLQMSAPPHCAAKFSHQVALDSFKEWCSSHRFFVLMSVRSPAEMRRCICDSILTKLLLIFGYVGNKRPPTVTGYGLNCWDSCPGRSIRFISLPPLSPEQR
jgi:hypothetical protein